MVFVLRCQIQPNKRNRNRVYAQARIHQGHDLLQLYHSILGNRVTYVAEADRPTAKLCIEEGESVVTELIVDNRIDGKSGA